MPSDEERRRKRFGVTRVGSEQPEQRKTPTTGRATSSNPTVQENLDKALRKGHTFDPVEVAKNGTQVWRCSSCRKTVKYIFEQSAAWPDGVGTWAIKAEAVRIECRTTSTR